ncbi:WAT1-related protein At4g01440-like [Miscanthus floridulus]|uniref:WAT1-related protein At4g01440-like n=1 Tax=Miscanthus floridulus TaxID=154761 RepID=UPI00345ACD8C
MDEWKPVMAMLVFNLISAVLTALVKKALEQGLNALVLITLRQLVATLFLAPIAYFKERNTRPKFTLEIFVYHFFSAALGASLSQYSFFYGLKFTTATFAITFANVAPVLTFFIAIALRAMAMRKVRHASVWIITKKLEIVTILYSGIMASAAGFLLMTWCVHKRGPVFTAAFIPIVQIMVSVIDFFFLHEQLYLGSVLGSVLMIFGLYLLLWGKKGGCRGGML